MTLKRTMDRMGYTLKLIKNIPFTRNSEDTIDKRHDYCAWLSSVPHDQIYSNLIFIDESGFNPGMRRKHGYNIRGFPAMHIQIGPRTSNVSIIGGMNATHGIISFENIVNFVNDLIQKIIIRSHNFGADMNKPIFIVWDNASIHKAREVQQNCFTEDVTCIHGLDVQNKFLPCYSPFLNPIEEAWSHSKFDIARKSPWNQRKRNSKRPNL